MKPETLSLIVQCHCTLDSATGRIAWLLSQINRLEDLTENERAAMPPNDLALIEAIAGRFRAELTPIMNELVGRATITDNCPTALTPELVGGVSACSNI